MTYVDAGITTIGFIQSSIFFALIVYTLALATPIEAFREIIRKPVVLIWGLGIQHLIYPIFIAITATALMLPIGQSTSMLIISLMPALAIGSLLTWIAGGHVALSLMIVMISSALSAILAPIMIALWAAWNPAAAQDATVQGYTPFYSLAIGFAGVLFPAILGLLTQHYLPGLIRFAPRILKLSLILALLIPLVLIAENGDKLFDSLLSTALPIGFSFIFASMYCYYFAKSIGMGRHKATALGLTIPLQTVSIAGMFSIAGLGAESEHVLVALWWIIIEYYAGAMVAMICQYKIHRRTGAQAI